MLKLSELEKRKVKNFEAQNLSLRISVKELSKECLEEAKALDILDYYSYEVLNAMDVGDHIVQVQNEMNLLNKDSKLYTRNEYAAANNQVELLRKSLEKALECEEIQVHSSVLYTTLQLQGQNTAESWRELISMCKSPASVIPEYSSVSRSLLQTDIPKLELLNTFIPSAALKIRQRREVSIKLSTLQDREEEIVRSLGEARKELSKYKSVDSEALASLRSELLDVRQREEVAAMCSGVLFKVKEAQKSQTNLSKCEENLSTVGDLLDLLTKASHISLVSRINENMERLVERNMGSEFQVLFELEKTSKTSRVKDLENGHIMTSRSAVNMSVKKNGIEFGDVRNLSGGENEKARVLLSICMNQMLCDLERGANPKSTITKRDLKSDVSL